MASPLDILILEDRADEAELLARELRHAGFDFYWRGADDRASYLAALDQAPDLILADYILPDLNALDALAILRERHIEAPFLVVTAAASEEAAMACLNQGAADYLLKDRLARLGPAVARALDQQRLRAYRRQSAQALRESATLKQAVLDSLSAHIAVLDPFGTIIAVNFAWQRFAADNGGDLDQVGVGVNYLDVCRRSAAGLAEAAAALAGIAAVLRGELPLYVLEYALDQPDGRKWFTLHVRPLASGGSGAVVSHLDITAQKELDLVLRASEERFRLIYQSASIGIVLADLAGSVLSCNPAFEAMLGYRAAALYHTPYWQLLDPVDQASEQEIQRALAGDPARSVSHERRYRHSDGRLIWGKATFSLSQDAAGTAHLVITLEDITQRKQAELVRSRLASIIDSTDDAMVATTTDGTIVAWNRSAEQIYGYRADEIIDRSIDVLVPPDEHAAEQRNRGFVLSGGRLTHHECVRLHKHGRRIDIAITLSPIIDDNGQITGISAIGRDISQQKAAERALRRQTTFVYLLQRVAVAANLALSLEDAVRETVEQICTLIGWPVGHAYLASDEDGVVLRSSDIWHLANPEQYALFRTITEASPLASLDDLPGQVLLSGRPAWVSDLSAAPTIPRARLISNVGVRAGFAFPVLVGAEVVAVLEFFAAEAIEPDPAMLDVMTHVGTQLGRVVERQWAEEALRASEERYRLIAESTGDVITVADQRGRYVYVSPSCRALLGYKPDQLIGVSVFELLHPENHQVMAELMSGQRPLGAERLTIRIRHAYGSWRWFESHCTLLIQGGTPFALGVSRDVTDRRMVEEAIRASEERYRTLFETMSQGIVYQDAGGAIISANPAAERILGLSFELMQGRTSTDPRWRSMHEDGSPLPGEEHPATIALRSGREVKNVVMGVYNPAEDRHHWLAVNAVPQFRPGESEPYQVYTTFEDITARKEVEAALLEERALLSRRVEERTADLSAANAELARAARLKDEFLASMSHELRTPLNAVLGLCEALYENTYGPISAEQGKALTLIGESGRHLLELINDILDLAKIGAGKVDLDPEIILVEEIVTACVRMMRQSAFKKQLGLEVDLSAAPTYVQADARRLKQILVNLLSNAVKFTPDGGGLGVTVEADRAAQQVRFTVWDRGIGIANDQIPRLFQPFVQLDSRLSRKYQGTGLGLALVYRLTEMHAGSITVDSQPGSGSRFTITLPWPGDDRLAQAIGREQVPPPRRALRENGFLTAAAPRILLAEDNQANITTLSDYLTGLGYHIILARNGAEAVGRAREELPDLILMDIQMPGMDGIEATRRIRADPELAAIPIIALTALVMPGDRERCIEAGASEYMSKPVRLRSLASKIGQLIQRSPAGVERTVAESGEL